MRLTLPSLRSMLRGAAIAVAIVAAYRSSSWRAFPSPIRRRR